MPFTRTASWIDAVRMDAGENSQEVGVAHGWENAARKICPRATQPIHSRSKLPPETKFYEDEELPCSWCRQDCIEDF